MRSTLSEAVALRDAADAVLGADLHQLTDDAVLASLRELECVARKLAAVSHGLLVQVFERDLPGKNGVKSPAALLTQMLCVSAGEARARWQAAQQLGQWHGPAGPLPEVQPVVAAAQREGTISVEHARRIDQALQRIPVRVPRSDRDTAERILVESAKVSPPEDVSKVGERILAHMDPDGSITDERDRKRRRSWNIGRQRADLMSPMSGELDPVARALLDPVLAKWARPGMNNPDDTESPSGDCEYVDSAALSAAAARDTRSTGQRNHDALLAMLKHAMASGALGQHRGLPVTTILTMGIEQLEAKAGVVTTASGGVIPIKDALELAAESEPVLAIFDHHGAPLHLGRTKRLANHWQRLSWIAAIRGCSRPGCDQPATMCAVHHVTDWAKGGTTDIDQLTLACDTCHALVHDGPGGWKTVVLHKDSPPTGRTAWIAPPHIDPTGTPRINHRHHPDELLGKARGAEPP